ncbi:MAG: cbb3-type cytochrome c oxidase N-terminal domain-containing protein [Saprospiraceae bacterium]
MEKYIKIILPVAFNLLFIAASNAQEVAGNNSVSSKLSSVPIDIYIMLIIIFLELIIILYLAGAILQFVNMKTRVQSIETEKIKKVSWFERLNKTVAIEDEAILDLKHNYDGIRELDNKTPGWWIFAFYFTILFGVVYLYRAFVSESMPDQYAELKQEYALAEISKSKVLSKITSDVDESNVMMLDAVGIAKGSMTFKANCVVCHGEHGEGNVVGPNLTDQYWIHKGGIKNIFKTIKYGWPEKGMKSWKDDFSSSQIAELASFVESLQGSNPPNPKEKQGELFIDSLTTSTAIDSIH